MGGAFSDQYHCSWEWNADGTAGSSTTMRVDPTTEQYIGYRQIGFWGEKTPLVLPFNPAKGCTNTACLNRHLARGTTGFMRSDMFAKFMERPSFCPSLDDAESIIKTIDRESHSAAVYRSLVKCPRGRAAEDPVDLHSGQVSRSGI